MRAAVAVVAAAAIATIVLGSAHAADPATLYVDNAAGAGCTDTGTGTAAQPFCTVGAAAAVATAGQTVLITAGTYNEHLTVAHSGTPAAPITFRAVPVTGNAYVRLAGPAGGLTIDGQHDVALANFQLYGTGTAPDAVLTDSSHLTLTGIMAYDPNTVTGIDLAGVTDSTLGGSVTGMTGRGLVLEADTARVTVRRFNVTGSAQPSGSGTPGIDILGTGNTIDGAEVINTAGAGILVEPGASGTILVDSVVKGSRRDGIQVDGSTATAITNNTVFGNCAVSVAVTGAATGASVENNIATHAPAPSTCDPGATDSVDIGVYGAATAGTIVDYNTAFDSDPAAAAYAWGTPDASLAAFRAASGQAAHDRQIDPHDPSAPDIDSASSAAPGFPAHDLQGYIREDDPNYANTGTGPVDYADRGATEVIGLGSVTFTLTPSNGGQTVNVDAAQSVAPWAPSQIVSYKVTYGDGASDVVPLGQTASHTYQSPGGYTVSVAAVDSSGVGGISFTGFFWTVNTALDVTTVAPATVASGHQLAVGTRLTRADTGQPLAGQAVTVQFQPAGTTTWSTVTTGVTNVTGLMSTTAVPSGNGSYRISFAAIPGYAASMSAATHVSVTVAVAVKVSAATVRSGTATGLRASAPPFRAGVKARAGGPPGPSVP